MKKLFLPMLLISFIFVGCAGVESSEVVAVEPSTVTEAATTPEGTAPQTFVGTATGYGGDVVVEAVVAGDQILDLIVVSHSESPMFYDLPFAFTIQAVLEEGSLNVPVVTGATLSSMAIRSAIMDALNQASFDTVAMLQVPRETRDPQTVELETEVVIVGSGGAGLSAGIQTVQNGGTAIVVERMGIIGGNTLVAGSAMQVNQTRFQAEQGIVDSPDRHFQDMYEGGDRVGRPKLIRVLVDNVLDASYWLEDIGVEWGGLLPAGGGQTFPRSLRVGGRGLGSGWIEPMSQYFEREGGIILTNTEATEIIMEDGRAVGIRATNNYGDDITIRGTRGVVIATGGFAGNVEMRMYYDEIWDGMLTADVITTNVAGPRGGGHRMAEAVGANLIDMGLIQLLSFGNPATGDVSGMVGTETVGAAAMGLMVNEQGERFLDENGRRDDMTFALLEQSNNLGFFIIDSQMTTPEASAWSVGRGFAHRADTIEELAQMAGIEYPRLRETLETFNSIVAGETLDPFGRDFELMPHPGIDLENGAPFFATPRVPTIHYTMGGIEIDVYARVINTEGYVIPGLFAAGEVTGGIHGANRLGGNALGCIMVFGRIAADSAMAGR